MPRVPADYVPTYRLHKQSGQAVVTLNYRDHLLGAFGSTESKAAYHELVARWLKHGRQPLDLQLHDHQSKSSAVTVTALCDTFQRHADEYYAAPDKRTNAAFMFKLILRDVRDLFGTSPADDFSPSKLKAVRDRWIKRGYVRSAINRYVGYTRQVFRWGVSEEMVKPAVVQALECLPALRRGKTTAKESVPVRPVPPESIDAIRPHVAPQVWALLQLQLHAGARGDELFRLRAVDIDMGSDIWTFSPAHHKTAVHGVQRLICFGPRCQEVFRPFLSGRSVDAPLFSPREANALRKMATATKGKLRRAHQQPNRKKSSRVIGDTYRDDTYRRAIQRGCDLAKIDRWHPHQLLHNYSTEVRRRHGIEAARAARGHTSIDTTLIYAERDAGIARLVAAEIG